MLDTGAAGAGEGRPTDAPGHRAAARRVVANSLWLIAQPLLMNAISLVATAFIARKLGRVDYGRFVFALAFIAMFAPLTNLGLRFVTIRHVATADPAELPAYVGKMWVLRLALSFLGAALAAGLVTVLEEAPETRTAVYLATAIIALQAVTTSATDVFHALQHMRLVAQVQLLSGVVLTVLSVVAVAAGLGLPGVLAAYVIGNACGAALAVRWIHARFRAPRFGIDLAFWRASLVAAAPLFFPNLVREAGTRLGVVLLGQVSGQGAVGTYGAASTLVDRVAVIPDAVASALFPALAAAHQRSREEAAALYRKFFRYFLVVGLALAVGGSLLAEPIIALVYGDGFGESPAVLALLAWGLLGLFFVQLLGWSVAAVRQEKRAFFVPLVATAVFVPLAALLVPRFGPAGLAVAGLALGAVHVALYGPIVRDHLARHVLRPGLLLRVLGANAIMAAAVLAVREGPVLVSIPVGAAVYGVALLALRVISRDEARELAGRVRRRLGPR
jgi:O-antigen/teichoic acid export membrane protein